jgi:hypothetical protein
MKAISPKAAASASLDAIIEAGTRLVGLGQLLMAFMVLPRPGDWLYRRIARSRYAIFGRSSEGEKMKRALVLRILKSAVAIDNTQNEYSTFALSSQTKVQYDCWRAERSAARCVKITERRPSRICAAIERESLSGGVLARSSSRK